jgi:hypothetical protein
MKTLKKRVRKAYLSAGMSAIIMAVAISVIPKRIITKVIAVLNIKKLRKIEAFSAKAKLIRTSMNGNAWFPSCPVNVTNGGTLDLAIQALDAAITKALTKVLGAVQARTVQYKGVLDYLHLLLAYVQSVSDANAVNSEAIIISSGFEVKHLGVAGKDAITVKPKKGESGTMIAKVKKIAGTVANLWEYSLDEGKTWVEMDATSKGTTEITGLKPGSTIIVNNRPVLRKSKGTWIQSQPAIVI